MEKFNVEIPVVGNDYPRFKKWTEYYKLKIVSEKKKDRPYITIEVSNPMDLYWLGANMFGKPPESPLTKHQF